MARTAVRSRAQRERQLFPTRSRKANIFRRFILMFACLYFFAKTFRKQLLPWGPAQTIPFDERPSFASIDFSNDSLQAKHGKTKKIFERLPPQQQEQEPLLKGPETVVFGKDGTLYLMTEESKLVKMTDFKEQESEEDDSAKIVTAKVTHVRDLGVGRPLGGKFTMDGKTLYIADALLGLTRIQNPEDPKSKLEIVASSVMDDGVMSKILYADDLAIGPKSGKIYFTDASSIAPDRLGTRSWDTLYASKIDLARGKATGRLLEYNPSTDEVKVLARGFKFANGIAVDKDEKFLIFAETFGPNLLKYHLEGELKGTVEVVMESKDMTGYPDGVDCSWSNNKNVKCYTVMPSSIVPLHKLWNKLPEAVDVLLRNLVMMLPRKLAPKVKKYGVVVEIDPKTKEFRYIQDPTGQDIAMLTGVTVHDNKLYLGSLQNDFIGVYSLK